MAPSRKNLTDRWQWNALRWLLCHGILWLSVGVGVHSARRLHEIRAGTSGLDDALSWIVIGFGLGCLIAGRTWHPFRVLGLIPYGTLAFSFVLLWLAWSASLAVPLGIFGLVIGLLQLPLVTTCLVNRPEVEAGPATATLFATAIAALLGGVWLSDRLGTVVSEQSQLYLVAGIGFFATLFAWWRLFRAALEFTLEVVLQPVYRFRYRGPGIGKIPIRGPVLVMANHAAWLDPLFLGKIVPRKLTPMMTSTFYDLPVMRWLMKKVVKAIRVEDVRYRYAAPELDEAIAQLDRGECVVIFPEGWLRRSEEKLLRQFGQGVWRILRERPKTPVVACWIEGNWGSFTSFYNGPPGSNKRFDFWRHITVIVGDPFVISPDLLLEQMRTRRYLMDVVLNLRQYLPTSVRNETPSSASPDILGDRKE